MERMPQNEWIELLLGSGDSVPTRSLHGDDAQVFFEAGDQVRFRSNDGGTRTGTVEKLNPKRARVRCGAQNWVVPYAGLEHLCATTAADRRSRVTRLKDVAAEVRDLMDRHGLDEWTLRFSAATKKLGECRSQHKLILISRSHAVHGTPEQVTDTICHEIAHALAGPEAATAPPGGRLPDSSVRRRNPARPKTTRHGAVGRPSGSSSAPAIRCRSSPAANCRPGSSCA